MLLLCSICAVAGRSGLSLDFWLQKASSQQGGAFMGPLSRHHSARHLPLLGHSQSCREYGNIDSSSWSVWCLRAWAPCSGTTHSQTPRSESRPEEPDFSQGKAWGKASVAFLFRATPPAFSHPQNLVWHTLSGVPLPSGGL